MAVVRVVAGVILDGRRVLVSRRPEGTHLGGLWEFPGGKVEPGETDAQALIRELHEELGISVRVGEVLEIVQHAYAERAVELVFHRCEIVSGVPRAVEVAEVAWTDVGALDAERFPEADRPLLARLASLVPPGS